MLRSSTSTVLLVLFSVFAAALAPVMVAGYRNLGLAQVAEGTARYSDAARLYESAARLLIWQRQLWEQAGVSAYQAGDQDNAIRLLQLAARNKTLSASGWDTLGSAYWAKQDRQLAVSAWQSGLQANSGDLHLLDHLASAYDLAGNYAAEQAILEQRLAVADDAAARFRLGLLLLLSDPLRAQREIEAAAVLDKDYGSAATTILATLRAVSVEADPARRFVLLGRGLGLLEQWGLAEQAFRDAIEADPQSPAAWAWLGEARQHMGQSGRPELDRALALGSQDTVVHVLRGLYWRRRGETSQALAEYARAAQIEPDNPALQSSLGEVYAASGNLVAALAAYQNAATLAPSDPTYWRLLALFCADNGVQTLEIGLPAAQKATQLAPQDPQALETLGWLYAQAGYLYKAQQTLEQAIKQAPDLAIAHVHLAVTYLRAGQNALALEQLNATSQLDPNGPAGQLAAQLLAHYFP